MNKIFKTALTAMVCILALGFASCSKDDNNDQPVVATYKYGITTDYKDFEGFEPFMPDNNLVKTWLDAKVAELSKTCSGTIQTADEKQLDVVKTTGTDGIANLQNDLNEAAKTYDFGNVKVVCDVKFHISKDVVPYYSSGSTVKYDNNVPRLNTNTLDIDATATLSSVEEATLSKPVEFINSDVLKVGSTITFDVAAARTFDAKTRSIYTGAPFFKNISTEQGSTVCTVVLDYKRANLKDYIGEWYIIVPAVIGGTQKAEVAIYVTNK